MRLEHRLQCLELKLATKQSGCNPTLFIVVPEELQNKLFDLDSYRPSTDEIEKYLKQLKDSGQCSDCKGSCVIDWFPDGFKNHTLAGLGMSSSPEHKIHFMFCANTEIPVLCRQLINGRREPNIQ